MDTIPLGKYVEEHGQAEPARLLGVTPGAIRFALIHDRKVYLQFGPDGQFAGAYEIAKYPRKSGKAA